MQCMITVCVCVRERVLYGEAVSYLYSLGSIRIIFWEFLQFGNFEITINSEINVHLEVRYPDSSF